MPDIENTEVLDNLLSVVPETYRKPSIRTLIADALNEHPEEYVRGAIEYTADTCIDHSLSRWKGSLKYCLSHDWARGYSRANFNSREEAKATALLQSRRRMSDTILKLDAQKGCKTAQKILQEKGVSWE